MKNILPFMKMEYTLYFQHKIEYYPQNHDTN